MRVCILVLTLLIAPTAAAQYQQTLTPEFQLGALVGGGWYDWSVHSYWDDSTQAHNWNGMGLTFGATTRIGITSGEPGVLGLMLALQGDLLSASDPYERFLLGDAAGLFALRIPVFLDGRSSVLLGGIFGIAFSNHTVVAGSGLTYGGIAAYRFDRWFMEARFQVYSFDDCYDAPHARSLRQLRQILVSVGIAL